LHSGPPPQVGSPFPPSYPFFTPISLGLISQLPLPPSGLEDPWGGVLLIPRLPPPPPVSEDKLRRAMDSLHPRNFVLTLPPLELIFPSQTSPTRSTSRQETSQVVSPVFNYLVIRFPLLPLRGGTASIFSYLPLALFRDLFFTIFFPKYPFSSTTRPFYRLLLSLLPFSCLLVPSVFFPCGV